MPESLAIDPVLEQYSTLLWWSIFALGILIYGVFSAILVYHWRTYAIGAAIIRRTFWWYFSSTGALLLIAIVSLLWATL